MNKRKRERERLKMAREGDKGWIERAVVRGGERVREKDRGGETLAASEMHSLTDSHGC